MWYSSHVYHGTYALLIFWGRIRRVYELQWCRRVSFGLSLTMDGNDIGYWLGYDLILSWKFSNFVFGVISWGDAAKFLTGFSGVGSIAIPAILHHAGLIKAGAMYMEFVSFSILLFTVLLFNRVSRDDGF